MLILHRKISSVSKAESVRELILISESDSKTFDNSPLTCHDVIIDGDGLAEGDTISYSFTGSQKWIGSSENTFTYSINNVSGTNYIVTCEYGELAVTDGTDAGEEPIDDALIVEMTADGQEGSEDETQYRCGDTVTFEISVRNPYADIETISLSEIEGVTLAQSTFADVTSGDTVSTTATYTIMEDNIINGSFTNTVTASIDNLSKSAECTILTEEPNPHLTVEIEVTSVPENGLTFDYGEQIDYYVRVVNDGNLSASTVVLDSEMSGDQWTIGRLPAGATSTNFIATYNSVESNDILNGEIILTATVTSYAEQDEYINYTDSDIEPAEDPVAVADPNPHLTIELQCVSTPENGVAYDLNENIQYEITIANDGNIHIEDINIDFDLIEYSFAAGSYHNGIMYPGETYTYRTNNNYTNYEVSSSDIIEGSITAEINCSPTSPDDTEMSEDAGTITYVNNGDVQPVVDPDPEITVNPITIYNTNNVNYKYYNAEISNTGNIVVSNCVASIYVDNTLYDTYNIEDNTYFDNVTGLKPRGGSVLRLRESLPTKTTPTGQILQNGTHTLSIDIDSIDNDMNDAVNYPTRILPSDLSQVSLSYSTIAIDGFTLTNNGNNIITNQNSIVLCSNITDTYQISELRNTTNLTSVQFNAHLLSDNSDTVTINIPLTSRQNNNGITYYSSNYTTGYFAKSNYAIGVTINERNNGSASNSIQTLNYVITLRFVVN